MDMIDPGTYWVHLSDGVSSVVNYFYLKIRINHGKACSIISKERKT